MNVASCKPLHNTTLNFWRSLRILFNVAKIWLCLMMFKISSNRISCIDDVGCYFTIMFGCALFSVNIFEQTFDEVSWDDILSCRQTFKKRVPGHLPEQNHKQKLYDQIHCRLFIVGGWPKITSLCTGSICLFSYSICLFSVLNHIIYWLGAITKTFQDQIH